DVALVGTFADGRPGFALRVGGGMSNTPRISRDLGVFVPVDEAIAVLRAVTDVWQHDLRYRVSRAKARIKFLVDDDQPERVRARWFPVRTGARMGARPKREAGFASVGVPLEAGRIARKQLEQLLGLL